MAHPLVYQSYVDKFRESEREVFLALSQDVVTSIREQLSDREKADENEVVFPVPRKSDDSKPDSKGTSYPDYDGLGDLELVIISCKELDIILTEQFLKPKHKDLPEFGDKIRLAINIDSDARHKLAWLNNQRDVFLTNRAVNNFTDEQSRTVYVNVCKDVRDILNPGVVRNDSNSSSEPGQNRTEMDKRYLITGIIGTDNPRLIKKTFILFCVILFFVVMSVLVYELAKPR